MTSSCKNLRDMHQNILSVSINKWKVLYFQGEGRLGMHDMEVEVKTEERIFVTREAWEKADLIEHKQIGRDRNWRETKEQRLKDAISISNRNVYFGWYAES